jgi:hypothetical protein
MLLSSSTNQSCLWIAWPAIRRMNKDCHEENWNNTRKSAFSEALGMAKLRLSGIFREPGRDKKRRKRIYIPILVPQPDTIPSWSKLQPNVVAYVTTAFESAFSTMDLAQRRDKKNQTIHAQAARSRIGIMYLTLCTLQTLAPYWRPSKLRRR